MSVSSALKEISQNKGDLFYYEGSYVTHLMKEAIGGNSLTIGLFTI